MKSSELNSIFISELLSEFEEFSKTLSDLSDDYGNLSETLEDLYIIVHTIKGNTSSYKNSLKDTDVEDSSSLEQLISFSHRTEDFLEKIKEHSTLTKVEHSILLEVDIAFSTFLSIFSTSSSEAIKELNLEELTKKMANYNPSKHTSDGSFEVELLLNFPEELKHPLLAILYRDISDIFEITNKTPSDSDLAEGKDFERVFITFNSTLNKEKVQEILSNMEHVKQALFVENHFTTKEKEETTSTISEEEDHAEQKTKNPQEKSQVLLRIETGRIDNVLKHTSQLVILKNKLNEFLAENNFLAGTPKRKELESIFEDLTSHVEFLQESVLEIRMTPFEQLFTRFPNDVKKIAFEFDKDISFSTNGQRTEIDKNILDELYEPIIHIIRNSIIHGIESPQERTAIGKQAKGHIFIEAEHRKNKVKITVGDDGKGIDLVEVKKKAIALGIHTEQQLENMSESDITNLIFTHGLTTSNNVNKYSGRGVGMSAFRKKIEDLQGYYEIETAKDKGTKFHIYLPLTTTIFEAIVIKINNELYSLPLTQIEEITRVPNNKVLFNNQKPYFFWRNVEIPILFGDEHFTSSSPLYKKTNTPLRDNSFYKIIIIHSHNQLVGLSFDEFISQQSIVVKQLHSFLSTIKGIDSYHTVSDGSISLIIDANDLT